MIGLTKCSELTKQMVFWIDTVILFINFIMLLVLRLLEMDLDTCIPLKRNFVVSVAVMHLVVAW